MYTDGPISLLFVLVYAAKFTRNLGKKVFQELITLYTSPKPPFPSLFPSEKFCVAALMTSGSNNIDLRSSISSELVGPAKEIQTFWFLTSRIHYEQTCKKQMLICHVILTTTKLILRDVHLFTETVK